MNGFIAAGAVKEFVYLSIAVVIPVVVAMVLLFLANEKNNMPVSACFLKSLCSSAFSPFLRSTYLTFNLLLN